MKGILKTIFTTLFIVICSCSFIFSIGFLASVAKIWWQVCLGWCWLVASFTPVILWLNAIFYEADFFW